MAMMPKRVRHRKEQRRRIKGNATRGNFVAFGEFGLQALGGGWLTARQIEAGRIAATHFLAREGKMWIRTFPSKPISKKPLETRQGKGKGEPDQWVGSVRPGKVLYEIAGVPEDMARQALSRTAHKMPFACRFVKRRTRL